MDDARLIRVMKALADPKRFRMVQEIAAAAELSCGQVGERFLLSQPAISHHLKILVDAGILLVRHEAQHRFISVDHALLREVGEVLAARLGARAPQGRRRSVARTANAPAISNG
ncbi:MAG: metalloregulator ArsR/SmtB family transcription factor [Myxococcaceae bacterium]|nr:metalloregulator ArsR/SmtB family transcription factor [Myxococcaceae bacterium]MCI0671280.1 metalloregulator ArsR/SmtB family transcription factor [Myxococcaceae bacterium]